MTDPRDLDSLIDGAARQMVSQEPSRRLKSVVMARLQEPVPNTPRRFMWATAAAAVGVCAVIAIMRIGPAAPAVGQGAIVRAPATTTPVSKVPSPIAMSASAATREPHLASKGSSSASGRNRISLPPDDISTIDAIETEPLVIAVMETPPIENEAVSIANLHIEPLTIEPLAAAND